MEYEIFNIFKHYTLETICIAFCAFLLTYIIKYPIKKKTKSLEENKRKMLNIIIMFVPFIVSLLSSIIYYGITKKQWISLLVLDSAVSSWVLSLSIYAIVSRLCLVIKGIKSGKIKVDENIIKENVNYLKSAIKTLNKENEKAEKTLKSIAQKLTQLTQLRKILCENQKDFEIDKINEVNTEIEDLQKNKTNTEENIKTNNERILNYKDKLYKKS